MKPLPPPAGPALQEWCDKERARVKQDEDDRWWHQITLERARRYWDDETGFGAQIYSILVIQEPP